MKNIAIKRNFKPSKEKIVIQINYPEHCSKAQTVPRIIYWKQVSFKNERETKTFQANRSLSPPQGHSEKCISSQNKGSLGRTFSDLKRKGEPK